MTKISKEERDRIIKTIDNIFNNSKQNILLAIDVDTAEAVFLSKGFCKKCIRGSITYLVEQAFINEPKYEEDCNGKELKEDVTSPYTWI